MAQCCRVFRGYLWLSIIPPRRHHYLTANHSESRRTVTSEMSFYMLCLTLKV